MIAEEKRVRVGMLIAPTVNPKVRQHVLCNSQECGWKGIITEADIIKSGPRRVVPEHLYICCPQCGGELKDLSTDKIRRWI